MVEPEALSAPARRGGLGQLGVGLLVSLAGLAFAVRGVAWSALAATLEGAQWWWLVPAFLALAGSWYGAIARQDLLLHPHHAPRRRLAAIFLVSHFVNALLPWKVGTFLRGYLVAQASRTRTSFAMATVIVERILDTAIVALLFAGLMALIPLPGWLREGGLAVALLMGPALLALVGLALLARHLRAGRWAEGYDRLRARWRFGELLHQSLTGLAALQHRALWLPLSGWTLLVALLGILTNYFVLLALQIQISWLGAVAVLVALLLGSKVPASPGQIGLFHAIARATLELFGVAPALGLAYGVLLHLVVFVIPAAVGGLLAAREGHGALIRRSVWRTTRAAAGEW